MTKPSISSVVTSLLISSLVMLAPAAATAQITITKCGQPLSTGANPTTGDALLVLKSAVGQPTNCDTKECACDVNNAGGTTTADALIILKKAVGQPVTLNCPPACFNTPTGPACTSGEFQSRTGSDLDSGWTGVAHNSDLILGASITFDTVRRCSNGEHAVCEVDADCGSGNDCVPTCDCNSDTSCEITGPTQPKNCFNSLSSCTVNADCPSGQPCVFMFGPPLPLSSGGTPVCVISTFASALTGTADSSTGEANTSANLRSRVYLGIQLDKPCPTCGTVDDGPTVGAQFTCGGGPNDGQPCTTNGVSPVFGGTSFDCPPSIGDNVSGAGLAIRFAEVTTGTSSKTAQLPCGNSSFKPNNPLTPGSTPKCIDKVAAGDPVCATNADCKRCTLDPATACTSNTQCTGKGTCAEAPDQPITCGYWCNCGFCNDNPDLPCFENGDCPSGQTCKVGTGGEQSQNFAQQKPNDCSKDKNICGGSVVNGERVEEACATTTQGECSTKPYLNCAAGSTTCQDNDGGVCEISNRPCFE
ncbi:MAG TPA: hypothetical protein VN634_14375, partial [Candidatus Limnocylindrales bacterium]|nr:hypothetical protein [Candidatus Limnocylindrales bacterium]